jgi:hypothetical protein
MPPKPSGIETLTISNREGIEFELSREQEAEQEMMQEQKRVMLASMEEEEVILNRCQAALGRREWHQNGARWRKRVSEDRWRVQTVISRLEEMRNAGKDINNPGAYAEAVWKETFEERKPQKSSAQQRREERDSREFPQVIRAKRL